MELTDTKVAIIGIIVLEIAMGAISYASGTPVDVGTVGMGITGIAGLAGYDMATSKEV